ncbi:MAG: hypothetical protein PQJ50_01825 [Spirochaetales bacterium]|nr:hypothetical protein [Spirochaetales bacterium]
MRRLLILAAAVLFFASCAPEEETPEIHMPATPILEGTSQWGVVNISYLKICRDPGDDQRIVTTLRQGDLVQIESVHIIREGRSANIWYNISKGRIQGWVRDSFLDSYSTREKAETASGIMLR